MKAPQNTPKESELTTELYQAIHSLNEEMSKLEDLLNNFICQDGNISTEEKEKLEKTVEKILQSKWITNLLPPLEKILTGEKYIRGGLEHALTFGYGASAGELLAEPITFSKIQTTCYLWRIIGPLLLQAVSSEKLKFSGDELRILISRRLLSSDATPERVKKLLEI